MTDNEIIEAWDICLHTNNREDCEICPHSIHGIHCIANLRIDTFNLLKRQQTEIEKLKADRSKGEWVGKPYILGCSNCHEWFRVDLSSKDMHFNYCPHCGAEMVGEINGQ